MHCHNALLCLCVGCGNFGYPIPPSCSDQLRRGQLSPFFCIYLSIHHPNFMITNDIAPRNRCNSCKCITIVAEMITEVFRFEPKICICNGKIIRIQERICICNQRFSAEIPRHLSLQWKLMLLAARLCICNRKVIPPRKNLCL